MKNSMLYWYPKIKDLAIPQPKTIIIEVSPDTAWEVIDGTGFYSEERKIETAIDEIGLPIFIRTDQMSGKFDWKRTCYLEEKKELRHHIYGLVDATLGCDIIGKPVNAFVIREYISMASKYKAFWGEMPVNPERRYFIEDGAIICHHPYWIKEAIIKPSVKNWEELSVEMNLETKEEVEILTGYAKMVATQFEGFWSVDFCKAIDGRWILIDMALGENSWHPEDCSFNRTKKIDLLKKMIDELENT